MTNTWWVHLKRKQDSILRVKQQLLIIGKIHFNNYVRWTIGLLVTLDMHLSKYYLHIQTQTLFQK